MEICDSRNRVIVSYIDMRLFQDILEGTDGKYSLKNLNALMSFMSGILLCFIITVCRFYGKDISIELPTLLFTTSLGLCGLSGWQNLGHYKISSTATEAEKAETESKDKEG